MLHTHICYLSCCCSISIYFVILPTHSHFAHSVCVAMVKHGWAAVPCSEPNRKLVSFSNADIGSSRHVLCHQNWSVPVKFGDAESKWCGCVLRSLLSRFDGRSRMLSLALFQSWKLTFFLKHLLCLDPFKSALCKKRFSVTSNLRYMHGVLNMDKIQK
jgi:hypothetical protein